MEDTIRLGLKQYTNDDYADFLRIAADNNKVDIAFRDLAISAEYDTRNMTISRDPASGKISQIQYLDGDGITVLKTEVFNWVDGKLASIQATYGGKTYTETPVRDVSGRVISITKQVS